MNPMSKIIISVLSGIAIISIIVTVIGVVGLAILPTTIVSVDTSYNSISSVFAMDSDKNYVFNVVGIDQAYGTTSGWVVLYSGAEEIYEFYVDHYFDGDADFSSSPIGFYSPPKTVDNYYFTYEAENDVVYGSVTLKLQESLLQSLFDINDLWFLAFGPITCVACIVVAVLIKIMSRGDKYINSSETDRRELDRQEELKFEHSKFSCPNCGHFTDGNFCEECGKELREEYIEF